MRRNISGANRHLLCKHLGPTARNTRHTYQNEVPLFSLVENRVALEINNQSVLLNSRGHVHRAALPFQQIRNRFD
jgi:hypothetical protein